jgi:hypothetical protein
LSKDWGWIIIAVLVFLLLKQQGGRENDEVWAVQRDERGRLSGITIHRQVR